VLLPADPDSQSGYHIDRFGDEPHLDQLKQARCAIAIRFGCARLGHGVLQSMVKAAAASFLYQFVPEFLPA
jgi:hypothetical protein